ncbi:MAG: hypothetical protein AAF847_17240 [Bacteroidota bacterium]
MYQSLLFILLLTLLLACNPSTQKEDLLRGKWEATELLESDSSLQVNLNEIWFVFDDQQNYYFHSTLNYEEAGRYELSGNLLYTTDTTRTTAKRKAVKLLELDENNLKIEMKDQQAVRILSLNKQVEMTSE